MNFNTNEKINQVTENTLVIGIDIAKHKHFACAVDDRGRVLQKSFPIVQSRIGFEAFYERLLALKAAHEKQDILVGFEPTGHYWMNVAAFLTHYGIPFVMVNPMHVNRSKELDDNLQTKNDQKDALVIARLMRDGRFSYPRVLEGVEAELRNGATLRSKLQEDLNALQNRIIRWLDRFFPEFTQVFKSFGKMAVAVLEQTPLPMDIQGKTPEELLFLYRQVDGMKSPHLPKAKQLVELAPHSIGLTEGLVMARVEIATLLSQMKLMQAQLDELTNQLIEFAKQMTDYDYLASVPGIGDVTIVVLCGKLLKILHALCNKKTYFNVDQMMNDFTPCQTAA